MSWTVKKMPTNRGRSLRASQEAVIRGVMPLGKGAAIPCEASLA